jgi:predicted 3-demethylubiquinone-9 3-methyltransferase (glyoxalase superfamily)
MQKITPFLWFNDNAEEAVRFYLSIFRDARITKVAHYGESTKKVSGRPDGSVMSLEFELEGQRFIALNGGPHFSFSPANSFVVNCETQREIDLLWERLSAKGETLQAGWLRDRFGISWQIVPGCLGELVNAVDPERAERVMQALLQMTKLDIDALKRAAETG